MTRARSVAMLMAGGFVVNLAAGCSEKSVESKRSPLSKNSTNEIALVFRKVINRPQFNGHDASTRQAWAAAYSKVSPREATFSTAGIDSDKLSVQYGPDSVDRVCDPLRWERELHYMLTRMRFVSIACDTNAVAVPKDMNAERDIAILDGNAITQTLDVGLVWHEDDTSTATAIVEQGKCNKAVLRRLADALKRAKVELRAAGFTTLACSIEQVGVDLN